MVWLVGLIIMIIIVILPVYMMFKYSISDRSSLITGGDVTPIWPNNPTLIAYRYLLSGSEFYGPLFSSLKIAFMTIAVSMFLGTPAAYVLSRHNVPGKAVLLLGIFSIRLFPDIISIIPVAITFIKLNLHNTHIGAALAHSLLAMPYVIYMAIEVFTVIPKDIEAQARILGAGNFHIFFKLILPLALPGLAAAAIYTFLLSWDEFIFAYFLLGFGKVKTMTLFLNHKISGNPPQNLMMAISMFLSLPVMVFTIFLQKYMKSGTMAGAVK